MPPLPLPIRFIRSSSEKFKGGAERREEVVDEDGAEVGGRGRGTAKEGSRWGRGRVRSGRRRGRLRLTVEAGAESGG